MSILTRPSLDILPSEHFYKTDIASKVLESCFSGVAPAVDQIKHGRTGRLEASMTARHRYKLHLHPAEAAPDLQSKAVISGEETAVGRRGPTSLKRSAGHSGGALGFWKRRISLDRHVSLSSHSFLLPSCVAHACEARKARRRPRNATRQWLLCGGSR